MWSAERMVGNIFLFTPVDTKIMWSIRIVLLRAYIHHILTLLFIFKKPEHRVWHCARCLSIEPRTIWHLNQQCIITQHNTTQYCKIYFWLRALASVWAIKGKKVWDAGRQNMQGHEFCAIPLILSAPPPPKIFSHSAFRFTFSARSFSLYKITSPLNLSVPFPFPVWK